MIEQLKSKQMLFIEDDEELSQMMIPIFKVFVKEVFYAPSLADAKEILNEQHIDLIFTDIHLKNENGLDFVKEIRSTNEEIPIIVLSGYKDEPLLLKAIPLGLTDYLIKPVNYTQLTIAFEKCIQKIGKVSQQRILLSNGFEYSVDEKKLVKEGVWYELKKKELLFMELLSKNKNRLITKEMIQDCVWEAEDMSDAALYNFIMRIRNRFGKDFIHMISNLGYRLG
ncbi:MAG: response regulator transcription factor [Sulfurospirillum sp.]|nr:response regulator transcription factor [Sulfurospirillum sp.]MBP9491883.1 response regulator transcription factor [Sulfurospirillum sp.]MBP9612886.1 response regulator transcription factor [Sulfurospirillum sp.]